MALQHPAQLEPFRWSNLGCGEDPSSFYPAARHGQVPSRRVMVVLGEKECPVPHEFLVSRTHEADLSKAERQILESEEPWCCAIVEHSFSGGLGLELACRVRQARPLLPILVYFSPPVRRDNLSTAYAHGLDVATRNASQEDIAGFIEDSCSRRRPTTFNLETALLELKEEHGLSPAELRLVAASTAGGRRSELIRSFGVSVNTLKSQTRSILKKTGCASLNELVRRVLVQLFRAPPPFAAVTETQHHVLISGL